MSPAVDQNLQRPISLFSTFSHHQKITVRATDRFFFVPGGGKLEVKLDGELDESRVITDGSYKSKVTGILELPGIVRFEAAGRSYSVAVGDCQATNFVAS